MRWGSSASANAERLAASPVGQRRQTGATPRGRHLSAGRRLVFILPILALGVLLAHLGKCWRAGWGL